MLDFSSSLYLGLRHPSASLAPWSALSTGRPAAMGQPTEADGVARSLAALVGCERATLAPSTLHLSWDLFGVLARRRIEIHRDDGLYAVGRWGVERAAALGARVRALPHFDVAALEEALERRPADAATPVVVTDGYCTGCGHVAPLPGYLAAVRPHGGLLVVDDTQVLGVLGAGARPATPFGEGGGGSLRHHGLAGAEGVLLLSSLAKGFGVPLALLAGERAAIDLFDLESETRVHASPPSMAAVRAAERALSENRARGDALRLRLARNVAAFRRALRRHGLSAMGGLFPVQAIDGVTGAAARALHARLHELGVRAVLARGACSAGARIVFVITAMHEGSAILRAAGALGQATAELFASRLAAPAHAGPP